MAETKARRRIREAVESRGRSLVSLDWEPWGNGGEKSGITGGWFGTLDGYDDDPLCGRHEIMGLSVDETVAWVDEFIKAPEPCDCPPNEESPFLSMVPTSKHNTGCRWHLKYTMRWWGGSVGRLGDVADGLEANNG